MSNYRKIAAIIQTRMGSTRLPGKVMMNLCGKPVIHHVIERVLMSAHIDEVVIATTVETGDEVIVRAVDGYHPRVKVFRGSAEDVLDRYYQSAKRAGADIVVRITSDCPLIDPVTSDSVIEHFLNGNFEYASNIGERSFPRGLDTEVFSFSALETAWKEAKKSEEREHVTPFIRNHPERFAAFNLASPTDHSGYRWTLDTAEDWILILKVYEYLYKDTSYFAYEEVLRLFEHHPELAQINQHIIQKA